MRRHIFEGLDIRGHFFLFLALSMVYGQGFLAMSFNNSSSTSDVELMAFMQSLVDFEAVGYAQQTRLVVPYLFTYLISLVGFTATVGLIESLSFFVAILGLYRCLLRYSSIRGDKLLIAALFGAFFLFWSIQQPGKLGGLLGPGFLLMALSLAFKPASIPFVALLAIQRLDLALVFIIVVTAGTILELISRPKWGHLQEAVYLASYGGIFLAYSLVVYIFLWPEPGLFDNPGLYRPFDEGGQLKITFFRSYPDYVKGFVLSQVVIWFGYHRVIKFKGISSPSMLLGSMVALSIGVTFGIWWEIRLFIPSLLLLLISLKYETEPGSGDRPKAI